MTGSPGSAATAYDVVILGGGPAGCAAGLTLLQRDDLRVALVEGDDYATPRIGESLSPGVRPLLDYLGIWEAFRDTQPREAFGSRATWGSDRLQGLDYLFTLHGSGWSLDRRRFDRMLARTLAARGGALLSGTRFRGCRRLATGDWQLALQSPGGRRSSLRARYLIDASGRSGRLARRLGVPRVHHDRLVGIARTCRLPAGVRVTAVLEVEACAYGWWYTAPLPGRCLMVVLMTDSDLAQRLGAMDTDRWEALHAALPNAPALTEAGHFEGRPRAFPAHSSRLVRPGGERWVAVGDAATSRDPLSSTGIPYALGSGIHGALVAASGLLGSGDMLPSYARSLEDDYRQYLRTHWAFYRREGRWSGETFWRRRQTPVTLDPRATVTAVAPARRGDALPSTHLAARQTHDLLAACRPGLPVHRSVQAFAASHPELPDQRIILGLQELVDTGRIALGNERRRAGPGALA